MQPSYFRKIKTLALICLFTCLAGVVYQLIDDNRLDYNSVSIGFALGLVFGVLEMFVLPRAHGKLRGWSFTKILLFKTFLYTAVIYLVTAALAVVGGLMQGRQWRELPPYLVSLGQLALVMYTLCIYALLVFFLQINHLLGQGVLWKFIQGKYHQPREEDRIFMFLDMRSSTSIAEQLGHVRFYTLLNDLFHEISQPVLQTGAEIYQYVGDEVVLTWDMDKGLQHSNCLKAYFLFIERVRSKSENYYRDFGVRPEFKAGLHAGKVVSAQIGDLKREIVYNGDVLNTASRIQSACNQYHRDFLVSGTLMERLRPSQDFQWEWIDTVVLRGKEAEVDIFSVACLPQEPSRQVDTRTNTPSAP